LWRVSDTKNVEGKWAGPGSLHAAAIGGHIKRIVIIVVLGLVVMVAVAAAPRDEKKSLFAPLENNQKVMLKETAHGFEITLMPAIEGAYVVKEVS
jgi:hypothetical protein